LFLERERKKRLRKWYNEQRHNLCSSPGVIRMRWVGHVACKRSEKCIHNCNNFWREETTLEI